MRKLILAALLCAPLSTVAACATVKSGDDLKEIFNTGVVAYDDGDYPRAYQIWSSIDDRTWPPCAMWP